MVMAGTLWQAFGLAMWACLVGNSTIAELCDYESASEVSITVGQTDLVFVHVKDLVWPGTYADPP